MSEPTKRESFTVYVRIAAPVTRIAVMGVANIADLELVADSHPSDYTVTDHLRLSDPKSTILLVDPKPAPVKAGIDALIARRICCLMPSTRVGDLPMVVRMVDDGFTPIPIELIELAHHTQPVTLRHRRILDNVKSGMSNRQIASRERVSLATVKRDLAMLFQMFDCANRIELAFRAGELGYVGGNQESELGLQRTLESSTRR